MQFPFPCIALLDSRLTFSPCILQPTPGTERNPNFVEDVSAALKNNKRKEVAVMCATGGTLETTQERLAQRKAAAPMGEWGNASRSLMAIYDLKTNGFQNVIHVDGGYAQWARDFRSDVV